MEEGHLSDARGRMVDFRNAMIVMTSNVGADLIKRQAQLGFAVPQDEGEDLAREYDDMRKKLMESLRKSFRPEFLNRVDATIVFRALSKDEITEIVDILMGRVAERLVEHNVELELTEAAKLHLADEGYDPEYGARPLRRVIQNKIEDALSDGILSGNFEPGYVILVDFVDNELVFTLKEPIPDPEPVG
jgi:ATP-dependent Clp protease ATP-binding subunit ClpC